ncbi:unnamed protein product [Meloidogyne enterolobii]|uniref:Uncharacterized protein n=1 Tax=Meloidogyne enterolobii TaxID=390850 RepID=A0ACB0ZB18_MELEN
MNELGLEPSVKRLLTAESTIRGIVKHEGVTSLYKGIWPALLKESTQTALSFFFYELACDILSGALFNSK